MRSRKSNLGRPFTRQGLLTVLFLQAQSVKNTFETFVINLCFKHTKQCSGSQQHGARA